MMNLEKMKQKKRTITKSRVKKSLLAATTFLCLTTPLLQTQTAYAAENTTPAITIEKPDGWKQGETTIAVTVDASHMPEGFSIAKIEAKAGKDGSWQDVTGSGSITITGNQTVYVRVTDGEGKVYEQNRSIKCYDTEKPTLSASLTDGVLTIQGNDTVSGITAVTVNGTTYTDLKDGMLRVQLTQKDFTTKADWLVGINASRLFSVLYNQNLKVGRVQTPTLAMIVDRNQKIKEFTKEKYYMAHIKFDDMDAVTEHFQKKEDADRVAADCMERMCEVEKDDVKEKTVRPPKLYDLTTLQREANRMFGYTAQQTLDAVQEMYEQKLVTYPRTDSQYLTDEMGESTETLIQMLLGEMPYAESLEYQPDVSKVLNSKKVSDHHAIIPTMEVAKADIGKLKERNCKILYLISARVLTATADPYIYESHKCQITCNYHTFYLTAKKTKQEGFKSIENKLKQFFGVKSEKEEPELDIWDGKHYGPCDSFVSEHFTQPPKQYTEDTLLSAMERAGNEELTEDTEKKGLGTPATRAAIIEKLIQSGFVKREKKNLVPTDDGNVLITVLPDEIKSPKMTAEWEMALNHIAQNTETADEFLNGITELMQELVARYQAISEEKKEQFQGKAKGEVIGKCPRCGADVREGKVNFYCSDRNCAFTLWKNDKFLASQGKKMDKAAAKKFLSKGKIHYKDLVSRKTGRQYEATVEMVDPGEGNVQFNLIFPQR